jgi:para-nitrobenzyl esterase
MSTIQNEARGARVGVVMAVSAKLASAMRTGAIAVVRAAMHGGVTVAATVSRAMLGGLLVASAVGATATAAGTPNSVTIDSGQLEGVAQDNVISFKGIPFAQPPVGDLRWKAPQAPAKWSGVRKAATYGADCMQVPFPSDAAPLGMKPAEDCLYLNVWRPVAAARKLPVLVWIYGGGFVNGGSSPAVYDGTPFARDGVLFVSFNYRLGRFGFFAHPALSAEQTGGPLGNYAIMDQIAALKWVRRNIAAFGGDPDNVTICGESAGGMSVHILMTSPAATGLFQKAIVQSGGGRASLLRGRPISGGADSAEAIGVAFAKQAGIEGTDAQALQKLRALPADALLNGLNMASMQAASGTTYVGGPVLDDKIMPVEPAKIYAAGKAARVPFMVGANSMDIGFMQGKTIDDLLGQFGPNAAKARTVYQVKNTDDVRQVAFRMGGDQMMGEPARYVARELAKRGQPVYEYRFSYVAESLRKQWPGAMHATDIPFAFATVAARYGKDLTAQDSDAARDMHAYWVAFAKTGKPEVTGKPAWPAYDAKADTIMDFTDHGPVVAADPWRARLDLAEAANISHESNGGQAGR